MATGAAAAAPSATEPHSDRSAGRSRFVVRPAPPREPPFDDEVPERHLSVVGPWDRPLPFTAEGPSDAVVDPPLDPQHPPASSRPERPDLPRFSRRFAVAVIEVATGRRSASQLSKHTAPAVQTGLLRDAGRIDRLGTSARPATIHSVHVSEPADGVAEVAVIVRVGDRFRALAFRLEGQERGWRCVRLQIG